MKHRVYITRMISPEAIELLKKSCEVTVNKKDAPPGRADLLKNIRDKDGILCLLTDRIDKEVLDAAVNLKAISTMSAGHEHIDVQEATNRGIFIGYTPGVLTEATADLAFALLLSLARRLPEADRFVRTKKWRVSWSPSIFLGGSVWGATLGIIGFGRIGRAMTKRASGFEMKVIYYDKKRLSPDEEKRLGIEYAPLNSLLKRSDYVTIHTPLTKKTHHLIDEKRLRIMKQGAFLINTSRGATVDEHALIKALKERWIAGAALDVFEKEPIERDNPLMTLENTILLPHIGSATIQTRKVMADIAAKNLLMALEGEKPLYCLNP